MNAKGHKAVAIATASLIFLPQDNIHYNIEIIDHIMSYFHAFNIYISNEILQGEFWKTPLLFFILLLGAKLPDSDLLMKYLLSPEVAKKRYLYHRQITHSILFLGIIVYLAIENLNIYLYIFSLGIFSHIIADILTGSVPIVLWGTYIKRYRFFTRFGVDAQLPLPDDVIKIIKNFFVKLGDKYLYPIFFYPGVFMVTSLTTYNLFKGQY